MKRSRYTPQEKVALLRRHLLDGVLVSDLCDALGLQPTVFYRWQKQFFEEGATAFDKDHTQQLKAAEQRIAALEQKLQGKNEVLSELLEEHVQLKKTLGET
jgi:transposase-like protein